MTTTTPQAAPKTLAGSAVLGLVLSLMALPLVAGESHLGGLSPVRFPLGEAVTGTAAVWKYGLFAVLPILLGLAGAGLGAHAIGVIDKSDDTLRGHGPAVFAILTGLLAVVAGGVAVFAGLIYPNL